MTHPDSWSSHPQGTTTRVVLTNLTFALTIFCYVKVLPIVAEIQPFAAAPAAILLALYWNPLKKFMFVYLAVVVAALLVAITIACSNDSFTAYESLQSFAAVVSPVLVFAALLANAHYLSPRLLGSILALWLFIGFSQAYAPYLQSALGLDSLFSTLISRYSPSSLSDWGRGATLLSPEPSYSARSVLLFMVTTMFFWYRRMVGRSYLYLGMAISLFLSFVNQSATMAVMLFVYAAALLPARTFVLLIGASVAVVAAADADSLRFVQVAIAGYDLVMNGRIDNVVDFTNVFGSQRTISVAVAYSALLSGRYLGGGFGSWSVDFLDEMERVGINVSDVLFFKESLGYVVQIKPYSHLAMMAFELGFLGLFLDVALIWAAYRATTQEPVAPAQARRFILATAVLSILFLTASSPVSAPEFWAALAIALNLRATITPTYESARA
jgi:hypothetical protein